MLAVMPVTICCPRLALCFSDVPACWGSSPRQFIHRQVFIAACLKIEQTVAKSRQHWSLSVW